jgi:hypothetical protein
MLHGRSGSLSDFSVERESRDVLQLLNSFKRLALRMARILAPLALTGAAGVAAAATARSMTAWISGMAKRICKTKASQ